MPTYRTGTDRGLCSALLKLYRTAAIPSMFLSHSVKNLLPHTTSTMTDCLTAGPETVSAHSLNLLKLPIVSATGFGNDGEKRK